MAEGKEQPVQAVQESIGTSEIDYFDVMIIGHTGQGKSTTSDKLLIANREGIQYTAEVDVAKDGEKMQLQCGDLTLWMTTPSDFVKEETRLKSLVFARTDKKPHLKIKEIRKILSQNESTSSSSTKHCEVFSNEMSRVRILDVPGFFDEDSITGGPGMTIENSQKNTLAYNLAIMRKILQIQTVMKMNFKRILYFLPVRGALERLSAVLQLEIQVLTHYFGHSVLKKLVLVATNPSIISEMNILEENAFPEDGRTITKQNFEKCLERLFPGERFPKIPLIYLSLGDTCESVLEKVAGAQVDQGELHLQLNPEICASCGKRVGIVQGERVICYIDGDSMVPYDESTCHPKIVPDYKLRHKVAEVFAKIFTFGRVNSLAQYFLLKEICCNCRGAPGAPGCLQVKKEYRYKKRQIVKVDHKFNEQWVENENEQFEQPAPDQEAEQ